MCLVISLHCVVLADSGTIFMVFTSLPFACTFTLVVQVQECFETALTGFWRLGLLTLLASEVSQFRYGNNLAVSFVPHCSLLLLLVIDISIALRGLLLVSLLVVALHLRPFLVFVSVVPSRLYPLHVLARATVWLPPSVSFRVHLPSVRSGSGACLACWLAILPTKGGWGERL